LVLLDPLIVVRTIHFAATIVVAGAFVFSLFVVEPVWPGARSLPPAMAASARLQLRRLLWFGLAFAVASGFAWLLVLAAQIGDEPLSDALRDGTAWSVLTDTQFGLVWELRAALALVLAALLVMRWRIAVHWPRGLRILMATSAVLLLGSLAWAGHAAAAVGIGGSLHLLSDIAHLLAAGAWLGGLVPLFLFMRQAEKALGQQPSALPCLVLHRFSALGIAAVATVAASGLLNAWFLTDHVRGLFGTNYGALILIKSGLFGLMFCIASINRVRLTPRVAAAIEAGDPLLAISAWRQLRRNTAVEIAIGLVIICVVGVLGVTMPSGHTHLSHS
jgi:copper resistance protein D